MSYALGQTPVPPWAAPDQRPLNIGADDLPAFMIGKDPELQAGKPQGPGFLRHTGRWNSVMNYKSEEQASTQGSGTESKTDPGILDEYDLNEKWENRMADVDDGSNGLPSLEKLRVKFIKNLSTNPFFPITLRGSAAAFSIVTLGLACEVFVQTKKTENTVLSTPMFTEYGHSPSASTIYTIVISCIAVVYLLFSLWDETFGQPLGLRPSHSKIKFVFIDLTLLCLQSANIAIAFEAMIYKDYICPAYQNRRICRVHKAVVSFILVTLVMHFLTFLVSTFRMIDRATH